MSAVKQRQRAALRDLFEALTCRRCGAVDTTLSGHVVGVPLRNGSIAHRLLCPACCTAYHGVGSFPVRDFAAASTAKRRISWLRRRYPGPSVSNLSTIAAAARAVLRAGKAFAEVDAGEHKGAA